MYNFVYSEHAVIERINDLKNDGYIKNCCYLKYLMRDASYNEVGLGRYHIFCQRNSFKEKQHPHLGLGDCCPEKCRVYKSQVGYKIKLLLESFLNFVKKNVIIFYSVLKILLKLFVNLWHAIPWLIKIIICLVALKLSLPKLLLKEAFDMAKQLLWR